MRRISDKAFEKKLRKWQHILKLDGWSISWKFVQEGRGIDNKNLAELKHCSSTEKVAQISFNNKYYLCDGHNISWNIDTLILHELLHVHLDEKSSVLPNDNEKVVDFEEFICNSMAKIIYDFDINKTTGGKNVK